jgi:hypothetical protein
VANDVDPAELAELAQTSYAAVGNKTQKELDAVQVWIAAHQ